MTYYHGGKAGLQPGQLLEPAPSHVFDGCYICQARRAGITISIGEWRGYLATRAAAGDAGSRRLLEMLAEQGAPDDAPIDAASAEVAVYVTTSLDYATWYAGRSRGDLYEVRPLSDLRPSLEDHFPSWTVDAAAVVRVLRRGVRLDRGERRRLMRLWQRADKEAERPAS